MLDPDCLQVFIAIAELGHFVHAADRLGIAQSVASKRLQRLEHQLGVRLLERGKRNRIRLTREGELFLAAARGAIANLEQAERRGRRIALGEAGPVRIGYVFSAIMTGVLPDMIRTLRRDLPDITVFPVSMETPEQMAAIEDGRIDFGLARPRPSYPAGVTARAVHRESVILALAADDPLAAKADLGCADLAGRRFIVPQFHEEVGLADVIHGIARAGDFAMPEIVRTSDFITAAGLAAAGMGIAAVPQSLQRLDLRGLAYRPISDHTATLALVLLDRLDAPRAARAALISAVQA